MTVCVTHTVVVYEAGHVTLLQGKACPQTTKGFVLFPSEKSKACEAVWVVSLRPSFSPEIVYSAFHLPASPAQSDNFTVCG